MSGTEQPLVKCIYRRQNSVSSMVANASLMNYTHRHEAEHSFKKMDNRPN